MLQLGHETRELLEMGTNYKSLKGFLIQKQTLFQSEGLQSIFTVKSLGVFLEVSL